MYVLGGVGGVTDNELASSGPVPPDGMDVWGAVASGGPSPRTECVLNIFGDQPGAIRVGRFKLVTGDVWSAGKHPYLLAACCVTSNQASILKINDDPFDLYLTYISLPG